MGLSSLGSPTQQELLQAGTRPCGGAPQPRAGYIVGISLAGTLAHFLSLGLGQEEPHRVRARHPVDTAKHEMNEGSHILAS